MGVIRAERHPSRYTPNPLIPPETVMSDSPKVIAGSKYGLRETSSRKRRFKNDQRENAQNVVDIRIETEKRKRGTRIERVTQVYT